MRAGAAAAERTLCLLRATADALDRRAAPLDAIASDAGVARALSAALSSPRADVRLACSRLVRALAASVAAIADPIPPGGCVTRVPPSTASSVELPTAEASSTSAMPRSCSSIT